MSNDNDSSNSTSRHPRNMQGLLRYAIETGQQSETASSRSEGNRVLSPLDDERRRWLDSVLSTLSVNVAAIMKSAIETLTDPEDSDENVDKKIMALDELMEFVENMDFANDFYKIGGFKILQPCLHSRHSSIRHKTAELIAELVQNNPCCQQAATESDLLPDLLNLLDKDNCKRVRIKALYAISGILRDHPTAQARFAELDGFSILLRAMQADVEKLQVKSAFLLTALCSQQPAFKDVLCSMGFVEQLVALIQREHNLTHEHLLGALHAIVIDRPSAIKECQRPELNLNETLRKRVELIKGKEEFKEELEFCQKLLQHCFSTVDQEDR